jgi:hypothetical protein
LNELELPVAKPTFVYCDNQAAIQMSSHDAHHFRAKHIDIRHHFIREHKERGEIEVCYVPTNEQPADIFTKALGAKRFCYLRKLNNIGFIQHFN